MQTEARRRIGALPLCLFGPSFCFDAVSSEEGDSRLVGVADKAVRVAIVEDDYLVASEMEYAFKQAGFEVVAVAGCAEEILDVAAKARPALAVMDIHLRGKRDGIDAALELYARHGIRCVFATAHQTLETRARAQPAKPLAWVPKPYVMSALVSTVRRAVHDVDAGR